MKRFFGKDAKVRLSNGTASKYREMVVNFKKLIAIIVAVTPAESKEPSALLSLVKEQLVFLQDYIRQYEALERFAAKDYQAGKDRKAEFADRKSIIEMSTMSVKDQTALIEQAVSKFEDTKDITPTKSL